MVTKAEARRTVRGRPYFSDNGWRDWMMLLLCLALPVGLFAAANFWPHEGLYKRALAIYEDPEFPKPDWAPPGLAFVIADGYAVFALGMSSYLVWKAGIEGARWPVLFLFVIHLPVTAALSHLFAHLGLAFVCAQLLAALSGVALALFLSFAAHSRAAALLLLPYLALLLALTALLHHTVLYLGLEFDPNEFGAGAAPITSTPRGSATPAPSSTPPQSEYSEQYSEL